MFKPRITVPRLDFFLWLAAIVVLWQALLRQLAPEWLLNPQYFYGLFMPPLCVFLVWRSFIVRDQMQPAPCRAGCFHSSKGAAFAFVLAFFYGLTRLIQEANPDWRLVSWLLAIDVVGLTWLILPPALLSLTGRHVAVSGFPLLFFFAAIPWPTLIERPVINTLTATIASTTAEVVGWFGVPAIRHGNIIEVGSGMVGIDDACSGIRSFQASLVVALFFGEFYLLKPHRRLVCLLAAFVLSIFLNLLRTVLLTLIAANSGPRIMTTWHDPAGVPILVGCFAATWLLAFRLRSVGQAAINTRSPGAKGVSTLRGECVLEKAASVCPLTLGICLGLAELGTALWYGFHEQQLPRSTTWHLKAPQSQRDFHELSLSAAARRILRFDEAQNVMWRGPGDLSWQAIFLRWNPGSAAVHLAGNHTPEDCLTAAGKELLWQSGLKVISVHGLDLPFRAYVARDGWGTLNVFYCAWSDRHPSRPFGTGWLNYRNRLAPVLAGERNLGQRSLELAVRGVANREEAEVAVRGALDQLIEIEH